MDSSEVDCSRSFEQSFERARAYGRAALMESCARRNFAAATIFIACVIFAVERTPAMRRLISRNVSHL